jgi:hypothetical protein
LLTKRVTSHLSSISTRLRQRLIGALLGTREAKTMSAVGKARAAMPFDP